MRNPPGRQARFVSSDELEYEHALKVRATRRTIGGCVFFALAVMAMVAAIYPIVLKSTIPLLWLQQANSSGWSKDLQEIGIHLLAKGRIEVYPLWFSIVMGSLSCFLAWLGATIIRLKHEHSPLRAFFSKAFWCQVYWWRKPDLSVRVSSAERTPQKKRA